MFDVEKVYGEGFFKKRGYLRWRAPIVCGQIARLWDFRTVCDVGCGRGDLVQGFYDLGFDAHGIEGTTGCLPHLDCPPERVKIHDLRLPIPPEWKFDLVTCFEVVEHLEPEFAGRALDNLCSLSDQLVTSISGATGKYHLNVQPRDFWERAFNRRNYERDVDRELALLKAWQPRRLKTGLRCFWDNLICFTRRGD